MISIPNGWLRKKVTIQEAIAGIETDGIPVGGQKATLVLGHDNAILGRLSVIQKAMQPGDELWTFCNNGWLS